MLEDTAQTLKNTGGGAAGALHTIRGAGTILARLLLVAGRGKVAGTAAANVVARDHAVLTLVSARVLILERDDRTLDVAVGIAGAATARVEAAAADAGRGAGGRGGAGGADGVEGGGHTGGRGGQWSAKVVSCAAAAGVDVGVLRNGGVRLGDGVARRHLELFVAVVVRPSMFLYVRYSSPRQLWLGEIPKWSVYAVEYAAYMGYVLDALAVFVSLAGPVFHSEIAAVIDFGVSWYGVSWYCVLDIVSFKEDHQKGGAGLVGV